MSLSAADKKAAGDSWAKMSKPSFQDAGERVFLKLLKKDSTKAMFKKFKDIPRERLAGNAALREHGGKVVQALDDFIKGLDGSGHETVRNVGRIHKAAGMTNDNINLMKPILLELLDEAGCGDAKAAWDKLWNLFMTVHGDGC